MSALTKNDQDKSKARPRERSFTLLETMAAMSLMITVMLHVTSTQGDIVANAEYGRRITKAMWLAKAVMAKVEYYWDYRELKQLESDGKLDHAKFKEMELPEDSDYTYSLHIEEWKFPILDLLQNGGFKGQGEDGGDDEDQGQGASPFPIKDILKGILGDHILKVAQVTVHWPEGAKENQVSLTYLLTNERAVDQQITLMEKTYTKLINKILSEGKPKPRNDNDCQKLDASKPKFDPQTQTCKPAPNQ